MYATLYVRLPAPILVWIKNKNKEPRVPAEKSEHYFTKKLTKMDKRKDVMLG